MSRNGYALSWGDTDEADEFADELEAVDATRDGQHQQTQATLIAEQVAAAVAAARPGVDKIPDPVPPAGEGALTPEEEETRCLCDAGVDLGNEAWFIQAKALDTMAIGRLFRTTPHKEEPERCYETIDEWARLEKGISVGKCTKLRAGWEIGWELAGRGYKANPGQVQEIIPVKNAHGIATAVGVYILVASECGPDKVTAERLRQVVKALPGDLELNEDDDADVLAKTIKGVLVDAAQPAPRAIPPAVTRAVDKRAISIADELGRSRIPRSEVTLRLLEAFTDPEDPTVYDAVLERMKQAQKPAPKALG
ncbi:hypothetical protein ACFCWY_08535 [Streptomyces sp. NPDC056362]|uniref:hypothetical protein n=1 Tax=unclassified Streptomyces TaxID=2593676 RepID=UPI0035DA034F